MRKRLRWIAVVVATVSPMAGCTKEASVDIAARSVSKPPAVTTEAEPEIFIRSETEPVADDSPYDHYLPEERVEKDGMMRSYLAGEMAPASRGVRRPAAAMMSNDKEARPQYDTNRTSVACKASVEGTMSRYISLTEGYDDLERIGSVRSYHTYYTYFVREFDVAYVHYGQGTFAKPCLSNVDNISGLEATEDMVFYRSRDREQPCNAYTGGGRIQTSTRKLDYTQDYGPSYQGHYRLARDRKGVSLRKRLRVIGTVAIKPGYMMNQAYFVYKPSDELYHRYQYGGVHQGGEGLITARNMIFQYCQSGYYATTEYLNINVHTSDCGHFMIEGKAIPISQEKDGEFGITHHYDREHNKVILNQRQTWIYIIPTRDFVKSEITGNEGA